jgi:hypothetical protein
LTWAIKRTGLLNGARREHARLPSAPSAPS